MIARSTILTVNKEDTMTSSSLNIVTNNDQTSKYVDWSIEMPPNSKFSVDSLYGEVLNQKIFEQGDTITIHFIKTDPTDTSATRELWEIGMTMDPGTFVLTRAGFIPPLIINLASETPTRYRTRSAVHGGLYLAPIGQEFLYAIDPTTGMPYQQGDPRFGSLYDGVSSIRTYTYWNGRSEIPTILTEDEDEYEAYYNNVYARFIRDRHNVLAGLVQADPDDPLSMTVREMTFDEKYGPEENYRVYLSYAKGLAADFDHSPDISTKDSSLDGDHFDELDEMNYRVRLDDGGDIYNWVLPIVHTYTWSDNLDRIEMLRNIMNTLRNTQDVVFKIDVGASSSGPLEHRTINSTTIRTKKVSTDARGNATRESVTEHRTTQDVFVDYINMRIMSHLDRYFVYDASNCVLLRCSGHVRLLTNTSAVENTCCRHQTPSVTETNGNSYYNSHLCTISDVESWTAGQVDITTRMEGWGLRADTDLDIEEDSESWPLWTEIPNTFLPRIHLDDVGAGNIDLSSLSLLPCVSVMYLPGVHVVDGDTGYATVQTAVVFTTSPRMYTVTLAQPTDDRFIILPVDNVSPRHLGYNLHSGLIRVRSSPQKTAYPNIFVHGYDGMLIGDIRMNRHAAYMITGGTREYIDYEGNLGMGGVSEESLLEETQYEYYDSANSVFLATFGYWMEYSPKLYLSASLSGPESRSYLIHESDLRNVIFENTQYGLLQNIHLTNGVPATVSTESGCRLVISLRDSLGNRLYRVPTDIPQPTLLTLYGSLEFLPVRPNPRDVATWLSLTADRKGSIPKNAEIHEIE